MSDKSLKELTLFPYILLYYYYYYFFKFKTALPGAPSNLRIARKPITLVRPTTVLTWNIPFNGHLKLGYYDVKIFNHLTKSEMVNKTQVNNITVVLHLNVNYTVSVRARNRLGTSNYSKELSFTSKSKHGMVING